MLCLLTALLSGCGKPSANLSPPPTVSTPPQTATNAPPTPAQPQQPILPEMVATIKGSAEIPVKAPQAGYLVRQVYKDGAMVSAGDTLFILDPRFSHADAPSGKTDDSSLAKVIATGMGVPGHALHGAGDHVDAGEDLVTIAQIDNVIAEVTIPQALAKRFDAYRNSPALASNHEAIELSLPDGSTYSTHGVIANIITSGDVNTMEIGFPNPTHVLQPGEFVKVRGAAF
jgi:multidrug efflux pump subunit AcrA (membrane-fusion protein)